MTVGKKFFAELLAYEGWLTSDHIDTIFYFIRKRWFENEKMFTHTCAILDVLFWSSIKGRYPIWEASQSTYLCDLTLHSYVHGKSPKPSVPWRRCDYCKSLSTMEVPIGWQHVWA
nr:uncharacterized protein LOC125420705 [Ziziphus jujuba var. spinosa]